MNATQQFWVRRSQLQQRSTLLRDRLAVHAKAVQPLMEIAETALTTGRWVRRNPWVFALMAATVLLRRPRSALRWAWKGWQFWRNLLRWRKLWLSEHR